MSELERESIISAERIKELRDSRNMTMEEFGKLFGVTKTSVYYWEHGRNGRMKASTVKKMAEQFNVSPLWLCGFDVPKYPEEEKHKTIRERISQKMEKLPTETLEKIEAMIDMFVLTDNKDGSRND